MGCTRSRGSCGFQFLASSPRPGEPGTLSGLPNGEARMKDRTKSNRKHSWWQLSLASLLWFATVLTVLSAWLIDHRNLQSQIKPPEIKMMIVHQLKNASPNRVVSELSILYPEQRFVSAPVGKLGGMTKSKQQSVIVSCDASVLDQIRIIINHFDRANTDMLETETIAKRPTEAKRK